LARGPSGFSNEPEAAAGGHTEMVEPLVDIVAGVAEIVCCFTG
jgi:hypothetical protein